MFFLKNSKGKKDGMFSLAISGFIITTLSIVASVLDSVTVGSFNMKLSNPDTTIVTALLGATLLAYVNRRNNSDKFEHELQMKKLEIEEKRGNNV